jgi:hypothetical protein
MVTTVEQFRSYRNAGRGYFVITDSANPTRIHDVRCSHISEDRFYEKVVMNHSKNGRYYWVEHRDGGSSFGARPCSWCL